MSSKDSLGDRMKKYYEDRYRFYLTRKTPVILRLDGKAFHTLTRECEKPFSPPFQRVMERTALALCGEIQGAKCAYVQSDEISILLTDFDTLDTQAWFDYNIQKIVSVSAGVASTTFSSLWGERAVFDARVFNLPKKEVCNYFIWRQLDWVRNSVHMLARAHFSQKQLNGKKRDDMINMLFGKGVHWIDLESKWRNGTFVFRCTEEWRVDNGVYFIENRNAVETYMTPQEE